MNYCKEILGELEKLAEAAKCKQGKPEEFKVSVVHFVSKAEEAFLQATVNSFETKENHHQQMRLLIEKIKHQLKCVESNSAKLGDEIIKEMYGFNFLFWQATCAKLVPVRELESPEDEAINKAFE